MTESKRQFSAIAARRRRSIEAFGPASEALGRIESGMSLFALTRGQFSMLDCIQHILSEIGPAHLSVWTWAIAEYEVQAFGGLIERGGILSGRLIVDYSAGRRNGDLLDAWRGRFGPDTVRVCKNHAKVARVWNGDRRVLVRGSMNLNYNPRFEQLDLTEGGADFELVSRIEEEMPVLPREHSHAEAAAASSVGRAFDAATLTMFEGFKPWKP